MTEKAAGKWRIEGMELYDGNGQDEGTLRCPYGEVGDRLWVREAWNRIGDEYVYRATDEDVYPETRWKPSIHMPRVACRILLEITDVRAERLQDISEEDAVAEGVLQVVSNRPSGETVKYNLWNDYRVGKVWCDTAKDSFATLWEFINGPKSWDQNPYVWVIAFEVITN